MRQLFIVTALTFSVFLLGSCISSSDRDTGALSPKEMAGDIRVTPTPTELSIGIKNGNLAPDVELVALDGIVQRLSEFRGQVVFLNFWATWCGYCREEMPSMEKMWQEYRDRGFVVLAVSVGESKDKVRDFVKEYGLTFPVFLDPSQDVYGEFNRTNGIPQTYIIDRQGVIRIYIPGSRDWDSLANRSMILNLLEE